LARKRHLIPNNGACPLWGSEAEIQVRAKRVRFLPNVDIRRDGVLANEGLFLVISLALELH
jgi:hypothetical protein